MKNKEPIVNGAYLLQKSPGKGSWTYASIPVKLSKRKVPFGWIKVKGSIDQHPLSQYKLMPMASGGLFLPVKADIRKKIRKQAGDYVDIILYLDESPLEVPEEIILCFENEPKRAYENFINLPEGEQKVYLDWIYDAKTEETKANRIIKMMNKIVKNQKLHDPESE